MKRTHNLPIYLILILGFILRIYGINWDQGFNLHPDERAIILFTLPLHLPNSLMEFLGPQSGLNPHFFAYGSLPLYILKTISTIASLLDPTLATYQHMYFVGRWVSVIMDLGTILLIYKLSKKLWGTSTGLISSFFYTVSVLPIQLSHFYTVDTPLTFLITLLLYLLILFYEHPSRERALQISFILGLSLATKNSAVAILSSVGVALSADFILLIAKSPSKLFSLRHITPHLRYIASYAFLIFVITPFIFIAAEPYAWISFNEFWQQTLQQYQMTHNAFTFPYTLQYVGKTPYIYELKNIFLWGMGPILSIFSYVGILYLSYISIFKTKEAKWAQELIIMFFFWTYFFIIGGFAIGFMRYMLPLYPILCIAAGFLVHKLLQFFSPYAQTVVIVFSFFVCLIYPLSFMHIYTQTHTRIEATDWILKNIPYGKTIAIEHWDDSLPLVNLENYSPETIPLYNADTPEKWQEINTQLAKSDYIVIASNRLYVPLQKLTDCTKLPSGYCYTQTATYYKQLFTGQLGYKKIAEFSSYPTVPILNKSIIDDSADESFTVYDHPKIFIFQKAP